MGTVRKPLQGVANIIRFNWHFYVVATGVVLLLLLIADFAEQPLSMLSYITAGAITVSTSVSLLVSLYVYDLSGLYDLTWAEAGLEDEGLVVNIHAGFDEISANLKNRYPNSDFIVMDFYDPARHTEASIKRARKAYLPVDGTMQIATSQLPLSNNSADMIFVFMAVHEIRDTAERLNFFQELHRVLKPTGKIYITEHLRDIPNLFAYNIGFLHFYSKASWSRIFSNASLLLDREIKITPFISTFKLRKNGATL
jgi:SAM-dependent methyltransferase